MAKGKFPYRRTLEFLSRGRLYLKNSVKVITIAYDAVDRQSAGVRRFLGENIPQVQYKNPSVQIVALKNTGKFPHINVYFSDGTKTLIDCESKKSEKILKELSSVAGKLEAQVRREQAAAEINPANFGDARKGHFCICEIPGQVPCPRVTPLLNVEHKWKHKD